MKKLLGKKQTDQRPIAKIQGDIKQVQSRLDALDDNLMDKVIDAASYAKAKARYTTELQKLQAELDSQGSTQSQFQKFLKTGIHLLEDLPEFYRKSSLETKRRWCVRSFRKRSRFLKTGVEHHASTRPFC